MIFISVRGISVRTTVVKYINNSNLTIYAALHELSGRQ